MHFNPLAFSITLDPLATFSPCGTYRYTLSRAWGEDEGPKACFVMLNPSTADAVKSDPTVTRCINFAKAWGYAGLDVLNLYAYRTPSPPVMKKAEKAGVDVVGPHNDYAIRTILSRPGGVIVAAWGVNAAVSRVARFMEIARDLKRVIYCLKLTKDRAPSHPLYLPVHLNPIRYKVAVRVNA